MYPSFIHWPLMLPLRRAAAVLHYRFETWFSPSTAVISYPKSGRTWLRMMLREAGVEGVRFTHSGASETSFLTARSFAAGIARWSGKRILLMIRDPRDTAVSLYFQATRRSRIYRGDLSEFLRDPRFGLERTILFNLGWLRARDRFSAFSLLTYEGLHADPHAALDQAVAFLTGRKPDASEVDRAVRSTSFAEMRALETSGAGARQWGVRLAPGDASDEESFKTRRGIVGGWRDYFTPADEAYAAGLLERHAYFSTVADIAETPPPLQRRG
jgi:hypothetical protein